MNFLFREGVAKEARLFEPEGYAKYAKILRPLAKVGEKSDLAAAKTSRFQQIKTKYRTNINLCFATDESALDQRQLRITFI